MWAVTGVNFAFGPQVRSLVNRLSPLTIARAPSSNVALRGQQPQPEWPTLVERARRRMPGRFVARLVLPSTDEAALQVLFAKTSPTPLAPNALEAVYLDQYTGEILPASPGLQTAGDTIMAWMTPLHIGNFAGPLVKGVWFVVGLAPAVLFVTGFVMWWTRLRRTAPAGKPRH